MLLSITNKDDIDTSMINTNVKIDLKEALSKPIVRIEIGCGPKRKDDMIGIDRVDMPSVDVVTDLESGLQFLPDNSVDEIHSSSCFEHIQNFENLMKEMVRVLKPSGKAYVFVPHFSNPHFYSDPTHVRFFGLYTFYYFVQPEHKMKMKRKVPGFYFDTKINIISQHLVFDSTFLLSKIICRLFGNIFNLSTYIQEFYEAHFCYLFPCFGINIIFSPVKETVQKQ